MKKEALCFKDRVAVTDVLRDNSEKVKGMTRSQATELVNKELGMAVDVQIVGRILKAMGIEYRKWGTGTSKTPSATKQRIDQLEATINKQSAIIDKHSQVVNDLHHRISWLESLLDAQTQPSKPKSNGLRAAQ